MQAQSGLSTCSSETASTPESSVGTSPPTLRSDTTSSSHQSPGNLSFSLLPVPVFAPQQHRLALPPASPFRWTMQDMELMHHFTISAPEFLASSELIASVWRNTVPKLAFGDKYGCTIHAMLAVASLHLGFLEPENRSMRLINATAHYDQAVRIISVVISSICKDNCEALFISSTLIVVFATASPLLPGHASSENESWTLPEWVPLIRGVHSILKEVWTWVETGCLSAILKVHFYDGLVPEDMSKALNNLYRLCTDTTEPDPEEIKDTETSSTYFTAIHELQKSFANSANPGCSTVSLIFLWPICVSDKYVALLKEKRPRALIIFAYYCALLKRVELHWWVDGRAEYELVRIERSIQELEKWNKWLEWPTKMVRGEVRA